MSAAVELREMIALAGEATVLAVVMAAVTSVACERSGDLMGSGNAWQDMLTAVAALERAVGAFR